MTRVGLCSGPRFPKLDIAGNRCPRIRLGRPGGSRLRTYSGVAGTAARTVAALLVGLVVLSLAPSAAAATTPIPTTEITVSVEPGSDLAELADLAKGRVARRVAGRPDLAVLQVPKADAGSVINELDALPEVAFAAPNPVARMTAATDDPMLKDQWHLLDRSAAAGSANWVPVGGPDLGAGATVAILDTGVTPHPDIDGILPGRDFISNDSDASDPHGHGTHVAGTVGESAGNGVGAAGIAPGANLLPVRVLGDDGSASYDVVFAGLAYAVEQGADVVNLSLAGSSDSGMCDAVSRAVDAGVIVVAATGNDAGPVGYPAACPDAIAVGAVTKQGRVASYSNSGPSLDLTAPGGSSSGADRSPDGILQYSVYDRRGGYYYSSGTSMASPHVAGAAAIIRSIRPDATPEQVREILTSTASSQGDPAFGAGILNIAAAVERAGGLPPSGAGQPAASDPAGLPRLSGPDRFATAAAVSAERFGSGAPQVWLATGASFADALASGAAAGRSSGPLLLVAGCAMPDATAAELSRLKPSSITVVGGPAAVCDGVLEHARALTGVQPTRVAGADRFDTAAALSRAFWAGGAPTVALTSAAGFADSLGGGALGARQGAPLLLAAPCTLPSSTANELARLRPSTVLVMGGQGAVCEAVLDQVRALTGAAITRLAGSDRFDTAAQAASLGWGSGSDIVYIASGAGFADGLAAGAAAAFDSAPLLLVPACGTLPVSVRDRLSELKAKQVYAVGGQSAICSDMLNQVAAAL